MKICEICKIVKVKFLLINLLILHLMRDAVYNGTILIILVQLKMNSMGFWGFGVLGFWGFQ